MSGLGVALAGAAALLVEVLAARRLGDLFGHDAPTAALAIAAWMGPAAIGALLGDRVRIEPRRAFAAAAAVLAVVAVVLAPLAEIVRQGPALVVAVLLAGPAALFAGAALPLAARDGRMRAGAVAAWQAAGGATGALAAPFALAHVGLRASLAAAAGLAVAGAVLFARGPASVPIPRTPTGERRSGAILALALGFVLVGAEALWTRSLGAALGSSTRALSLLLAVTIAALAAGAARASRRPLTQAAPLVAWTGAFVAASGVLVGLANARDGSGVFHELAIAFAIAAPPAFVAGAAYAALLGASARPGETAALETLGCLVAGAVVLPIVVPRIGLGPAFVLVGGVAAIASLPRAPGPVAAAAVAAAGLLVLPPMPISRPGDARIVETIDGAGATVSVVDRADGDRQLRFDGRWGQGGTRGAFLQTRQGHLPMLLSPRPRRVLVLGVGTGDTLRAIARHDPARLVGVEIVPEVLRVLGRFGPRPRATLVAGDGGARIPSGEWDVVVGDVVHPFVAGANALLSRDHHARVRRRLARGGIAATWLPLHELSRAAVASAVAAFLDVHPSARGWLGSYNARTPVLLLSSAPLPSAETLAARIAGGPADDLASVDLETPADVLGLYVLGPTELRALARGATATTDDRPVIEHLALESRRAGEVATAARSLRRILALGPPRDRPPTLAARARAVRTFVETQIREQAGDRDLFAGYQRAVAADPTLTAAKVAADRFRAPTLERGRAALAAFETGDLDQAWRLAGGANRTRPTEPLALEVLGMVAKERGDLGEAAELFAASVHWGGSLSARRRLVVARVLTGDREGAGRALDEALAVAPDDPLLQELEAVVVRP